MDKDNNIVELKNISFTYPGAESQNLKDINLQIQRGDFLAIIGNNGCGKSTLCKVLNGLIPHYFTGDFFGEAYICGNSTINFTVGDISQMVGYVYQDFENQILRPQVLEDASFACLNYAMEDYIQKGLYALTLTGLEDKKHEYVWQLSGGQKHLLALSGALALDPEILVLDEPIAQLDPQHAKDIYNILRMLNEEKGKTIIVIEHHTEFIAEYCKNVVKMEDGEIRWKLPVREALNRVDELINSNIFPPQVTEASHYISKVIGSKSMLPITLCEGETYFSAIKEHCVNKCKKISCQEAEVNIPVIEFKNVYANYSSIKGPDKTILQDFNLNINNGDKIAIIGNNGAGKSSILKLMAGIVKPIKGKVSVYGQDTLRFSPDKISDYLSLVYQNPEEMFVNDSIRGDIEYSMRVRGKKNYKEKTEELLETFNLREISSRDGRLLSGGQMRRASLAIGMSLSPKVILLDEPTANLDIATKNQIITTLNVLKEELETIVIATHDMQLVCEWANRIIVLNNGNIIADGKRDDIFTKDWIIETCGIKPPQIFELTRRLNVNPCYTISDFISSFEFDGEGCRIYESII